MMGSDTKQRDTIDSQATFKKILYRKVQHVYNLQRKQIVNVA